MKKTAPRVCNRKEMRTGYVLNVEGLKGKASDHDSTESRNMPEQCRVLGRGNSAVEALDPPGQQMGLDIEQSPSPSSGKGEGSVPETRPGWWFSGEEMPALITHIHAGAVSVCSSRFYRLCKEPRICHGRLAG